MEFTFVYITGIKFQPSVRHWLRLLDAKLAKIHVQKHT